MAILGERDFVVLRRDHSWVAGNLVPSNPRILRLRASVQPYVDRLATPSLDGASSTRQWRAYVPEGQLVLRDAARSGGLADYIRVDDQWVEVRATEDWRGSHAVGFGLAHRRYMLVEPSQPGATARNQIADLVGVETFETTEDGAW